MELSKKDLVIKRALLSVSDKTGIGELAKTLHVRGVEIISSGGTAKYIEELGLPVTPVESVTGNPEAFDGRMKTLSFQISSSLLFRRGNISDEKQAEELGILPIDLVVCNLYPFEDAARNKCDWSELIDNIDIGGPTMIRAAAKNFEHVCVMTSPDQYPQFTHQFEKNGALSFENRKSFSLSAFKHTADYDSMIARTFFEKDGLAAPFVHLDISKGKALRYGENPHQSAKVICEKQDGLAGVTPLQGKELSYNNLMDTDAAYRCCMDLEQVKKESGLGHSCVIVKHANPCGVSVAGSGLECLQKAWEGDPVSAFGSIISFGQKLTLEVAQWLSDKFVEVIVAPDFEQAALDVFSKKKNLRILKLQHDSEYTKEPMVKKICGGYLIQNEDDHFDRELQSVTNSKLSKSDEQTALFGLVVTKHLKSNAISLVSSEKDACKLIGAGMGNPNRLISTKQAIDKARENGHENLNEVLLISDAFFPFRDNVDLASEFGIKKIIQPGGSIRDNEVIEACDQHGISMAFTGKRHFRH